ncbi:MAG: hypothetical protein LH614_14350 [Pyrinomonadaceae bacterium]|nr:hypothetical protein [Pyrinomonadaceae bacterium]
MEPRGANSTGIKPLTKRTMRGELYLRRADAELQIEKVLMLEKPQILEMLGGSERRDEADCLLDETLVYLFREARRAGDDELFNQLYTKLNRRTWKLFLKFRSTFHSQADFEDFGQKTETAILRKLLNTDSDRADFAQVQFGSFIISEAKSVWKQNLATIKRDQGFLDTPREDDDDETGANELENLAVGDLSDERKMIIREGLSKLSPDQQTVAAMLLDGFQIESKDKNELTISRLLGVSSRTIRNWIKEMRSALADYKEVAKR